MREGTEGAGDEGGREGRRYKKYTGKEQRLKS